MNTRPDNKVKNRTHRSRWLLPIALSLLVGACIPPAFAVNGNDASLLKLEQKFFYTTYSKETIDARLDRLEKMIFGEAKDGSEDARLNQLVSAVPNLNKPADGGDTETAHAPPPRSTNNRQAPPPAQEQYDDEPKAQKSQPGNYPAVTAIERKILGKDFQTEPVDQRMARLETKVFGKPSGSQDLTDRMDRLKASTGVDITRQAPPNSEWAEEDDDDTFTEPPAPVAKSGEDGKSFSGRDLRQDMRRAFGMTNSSPRPTYGGQSGMYGSGGLGSSSSMGAGSGAYGMGAPRAYSPQKPAPYAPSRPSASSFNMDDEDDDLPITAGGGIPVAPDRRLAARPPQAPTTPPGIGLNQHVSLMEQEVFGKTYKDPMPQRVERLEKSLFPNERPQTDRALPDRVQRLAGVIQVSPVGARSPQVAQGYPTQNDRFEDDDLGMSNMPQPRQGQGQGQRGGGGLGRIINSISNLLGGGFAGGYPMQSGNVITDPRTGLLLDTVTGNLIDPATGMVVGQRAVRGYGTGFPGMGGMGGFSNFNNGFAPFGMGTGGIRFGGSGMGFGAGRMWP